MTLRFHKLTYIFLVFVIIIILYSYLCVYAGEGRITSYLIDFNSNHDFWFLKLSEITQIDFYYSNMLESSSIKSWHWM